MISKRFGKFSSKLRLISVVNKILYLNRLIHKLLLKHCQTILMEKRVYLIAQSIHGLALRRWLNRLLGDPSIMSILACLNFSPFPFWKWWRRCIWCPHRSFPLLLVKMLFWGRWEAMMMMGDDKWYAKMSDDECWCWMRMTWFYLKMGLEEVFKKCLKRKRNGKRKLNEVQNGRDFWFVIQIKCKRWFESRLLFLKK